MKKVLLVSPFPYSKTGRGMDVLTECFEECEWQTTHLLFPKVFYSVDKTVKFETKVIELIAKKVFLPYVDSVMKWFPPRLFRLMVRYQSRKVHMIDFSSYDFIVIESGKPLFLLDLIPNHVKIIYRQSDSVRHVLGENKSYIGLEDMIYERSEKIIVVKDRFKNILPESIHMKVSVIRNGYSIPEGLSLENPYPENTENAIYVGLTKLDVSTIKEVCKTNPDLNLHIFGACLKKVDLLKLKNIQNFYYYGFQPREKYLSFIKFADVAVFPFKDWDGMKWVGFTTKYLNFMYFKLPIVSYLTGEKCEFDGMGVHFAENAQDFAEKVSEVIRTEERGSSNIDFHFFSHEERKKEYKQFINSLE